MQGGSNGGAAAVITGPLASPQRDQVLRLAAAAAAADGVMPLSEAAMLHVRYGGGGPSSPAAPSPAAPSPGIPGRDGGSPEPAGAGLDLHTAAGTEITGYAYLDMSSSSGDASSELVVHPAHRRRGYGRALLTAAARAAGGRSLRVWAHGDLPAAASLARAAGLRRVRTLWQMCRSLSEPLRPPVLPGGVTVRTFVPGRDEDQWLRLNARAFAGHPEQGGWTRADLDLREREPWFDPAGFFIAERDGHPVGFHWTKIHGSGPTPGQAAAGAEPAGHGAVGEVYVVGVDPAEQGTGLGRALTLTGLRYLRDRGLPGVMLYVDGANEAAIRLYESLGFTRQRADVMYGNLRDAAENPRLRPDAEHLVQLFPGQRPVTVGDRAQHLGIELDLVESHPIVQAQVDIFRHRVHLPPPSGALRARDPGYVVSAIRGMAHQGHSLTTLPCRITRVSGNNPTNIAAW